MLPDVFRQRFLLNIRYGTPPWPRRSKSRLKRHLIHWKFPLRLQPNLADYRVTYAPTSQGLVCDLQKFFEDAVLKKGGIAMFIMKGDAQWHSGIGGRKTSSLF